jgi:hypothetical protein
MFKSKLDYMTYITGEMILFVRSRGFSSIIEYHKGIRCVDEYWIHLAENRERRQ